MRTPGSDRALPLAVGMIAAAALALAGCGGGGDASAEARAGARTATTAPNAAAKPAQATGPGACAAQLADFVGAMARLRTNLVAGLDYEGYVGEVRRIRRAYREIPVDRLALDCLHAAGTPAEAALNRYIAAANVWTACVEVPSCQSSSIEAELQARWRQASGYLSKAERGLRHQAAS